RRSDWHDRSCWCFLSTSPAGSSRGLAAGGTGVPLLAGAGDLEPGRRCRDVATRACGGGERLATMGNRIHACRYITHPDVDEMGLSPGRPAAAAYCPGDRRFAMEHRVRDDRPRVC